MKAAFDYKSIENNCCNFFWHLSHSCMSMIRWFLDTTTCRDRIVVSTLRCGRSNPGSNPGHDSVHSLIRQMYFLIIKTATTISDHNVHIYVYYRNIEYQINYIRHCFSFVIWDNELLNVVKRLFTFSQFIDRCCPNFKLRILLLSDCR